MTEQRTRSTPRTRIVWYFTGVVVGAFLGADLMVLVALLTGWWHV